MCEFCPEKNVQVGATGPWAESMSGSVTTRTKIFKILNLHRIIVNGGGQPFPPHLVCSKPTEVYGMGVH